jgi:subtilisin family serine protease
MKLRSLVTLLCLAFTACAGDSPLGGELPDALPDEKVDADVRTALGAGGRIPVLLLGRTQLFSGPTGFTRFQQQNAGANRRQLRGVVIQQLQAIAARDRPALVRDLPAQALARPLWILNAVAASLTADEIARNADNPSVAYIYALRALPPVVQDHGHVAAPGGVQAPPFSAAGKTIPWNVQRSGAPQVWSELGITGADVVVAIIDEGVAYTHPDLRNNLWVNRAEIANNRLDDDGNGWVDDLHGYNSDRDRADSGNPTAVHGTAVAGIVAGDGTNGTVTGLAPRARIMPLIGSAFVTTALNYQYALQNGADVVNMSFSVGGQRNLRGAWRMISEHATAAGLVLVSGAGNFQQTEAIPVQLRVPEDIPAVIAVGGVDENLALQPFSGMGPVEWGSVRFYHDHPMPPGLVKPDVSAFPGPRYPLLQFAGGYVDPNMFLQGNSFSSPHVAGVAALILSAAPELPAWRVKEILEATAREIPPAGKDTRTGAGLVDAYAAVRAARTAAR